MTRTRSHHAALAVMSAMLFLLMLPSWASAAPANDDFANRLTISGQSASVGGTNVGYTGSTLGSLAGRAANDDACGLGSEVRFNATDNTTYQILVDGYSGSEGNFTLEVNLTRVIDCRIGQRVCAGTDTSDRMLGTGSEDNIQSGGGNDQIYAGRASDLAIGGTGNDVVNGMKGRDRLAGGYGDDVLHTGGLDEARDAVNCGPGWDTVYRERALDTVSDDCEEVIRYGSGGGGGGY